MLVLLVEYVFLATFYGLYLNHQLHIAITIFSIIFIVATPLVLLEIHLVSILWEYKSPSLEQGSLPHLVRLQSKELKGEETRNIEDGQKMAWLIF